jgi:hypothetical protein
MMLFTVYRSLFTVLTNYSQFTIYCSLFLHKELVMKTQHASRSSNSKQSVSNNQLPITTNQISKRSNVMNATNMFSRTLVAVVSLFLIVGLTMGQNVNLNGSGGTLSGTYNIKGNINTTSASGAYTFGTVNLNGTGTTDVQTIASGGGASTAKAVVFANLNAGSGASAKRIAQGGIVTVSSAFVLNVAGSGGDYAVGANTLNFGGTVTNTAGSFDASNASSVVNYTSGGAQAVFASTYGGTLGLSGAGAKTLGGDVTAAIVSHTASSGALTLNNSLTINGTSASTLDSITVNSSKILDVTNTGGLTITTLTANNGGTIRKTTTAGTITFTNNVVTAGTITASAGTLTFSGTADAASGGTISLSSSATANFASDLTKSAGTLTFGGTSQVNFTSASAQNIQAPVAFYNATMSGNGAKTFTDSDTITFASSGTFANADQTTDFGTNVLSYSGATLSQTSGTVKFGGASNGVLFTTGTVEYNGTVTQLINGHASDKYATIILSGTGQKDVTVAGGTVNTTSSLTVGNGITLNVDGASGGGVVIVEGDLNVNGNGAITNAGTVTVGL